MFCEILFSVSFMAQGRRKMLRSTDNSYKTKGLSYGKFNKNII